MRKTSFIMRCLMIVIMASMYHSSFSATVVVNTSDMTTGGKYGGKISSPFSGIALYANGDYGATNVEFPEGNGEYEIRICGASSNTSKAGVSLYIEGTKVEEFSFSGTAESIQKSNKKLVFSTEKPEIKLLLETDNGSNDTYIKYVEFEFIKPIVERPAPTLPSVGAYTSGEYRNLFAEAGHTEYEVNARLNELWNKYFCGDSDNERIYYEYGDDEAYILDVNNDDVRSEGMSYGMMICVQLDKQQEFNRLWKWVKSHMQLTSGAAKGYIGWKINKDASNLSSQCAPDGDEYIIMALMFAAGRWGNGEGIFNYWKEANEMLNNSLSKDNLINSSTVNMFNEDERQVVFVPYASSAQHTDPSYHMPAFYRLWAEWADYNRPFWKSLAQKSREMYPLFANSTTGLMPDYANFSGTPTGSGHQEFRHDAWRCAMHMGTDYSWFAEEENETVLIDRLLSFFESEGITSYGSEYNLNGTKLTSDHSPGLVACNTVGALASTKKCVWDIVDDMLSASLTMGRYRYYDGMLYFLGFLQASGNFRIYKPAEVLETALDEQYAYSDDGQYLIIDDYEDTPETYCYFMRMTESSTATAFIDTNPTNSLEHALHIKPGNYDEFYYLKYTLPATTQLSTDYSQVEFDIYYVPEGDNKNQTLKVCINDVNSTIYTESTGDTSTHGVWKHVTVPLSGSYGNSFKLYIGVRTRNADFYIDNLSLRCKNIVNCIDESVGEKDIRYTGTAFNILGQAVDSNYKGIVIKNGKKYMIK